LQRAGVSVLYANDSVLKRIRIKASLQREITNLFVLPWTGLFRIESKLLPALSGSITFSKRARVPTLNELYFDPGGNMRLKPEVSRNIEGSLRYRAQTATQQLDAEVSVYGRQVNNWIAWYGSSILTPQNIMQVFSRGAEWNIQYAYLLGESKTTESGRTNKSAKSAIHTGLLYAYTIATTTKSAIVNDFSVDKQIPYVPRYQVKANIGFTYHQFECSYIHTYTGYRFITTDESAYLLPYQTSNIVCTAKLPTQKIGCDLSIRLQNLLSARYESIAGRVMPGRNAAIGFRFYEMP
jgi:vitamin B12 transporter